MADDRVPLAIDKVPEPTPAENEAAQTEPAKREPPLGFMDDLEYHRVADWFEISFEDRNDQNIAERLSFLYDWAKDVTNSDDRMERLAAIKNIKSSLGMNTKGKEALKKLYQWARLDQSRRKIEKEMELIHD